MQLYNINKQVSPTCIPDAKEDGADSGEISMEMESKSSSNPRSQTDQPNVVAQHSSDTIILKSGSKFHHNANRSGINPTQSSGDINKELPYSAKTDESNNMSLTPKQGSNTGKSLPKLPELPQAVWLDKSQTVLLKWVAEKENIILEVKKSNIKFQVIFIIYNIIR